MKVKRLYETLAQKAHFITSLPLSLFHQFQCHQFQRHLSQSDLLNRAFQAMHSSARSRLKCIALTFKTKEKTMMQYYMSLLYFHLIISTIYCKIPNVSPGLIEVRKPFLEGLYSGGLISGGAYIRRAFCVSVRV